MTAAERYLEKGFAVFPCRSGGKEPLTLRGFKDASKDPAQIARWQKEFPRANIAISTGAISGLVVLDVDPRHGGQESLGELQLRNAPLPETLTSRTGGGGMHLFFCHPGGVIACSTGRLGPGLDVRGDGGYVI